MSQQFNWTRYWYPSKIKPDFPEGFLRVAQSQTEQLFLGDRTPYGTLEQLAQVPCLILLGERGAGKSHTIEAFSRSTENSDTVHYRFHNLRNSQFGDRDDIKEEIFLDPVFEDWLSGDYQLHLFLDSLDESVLQITNVARLLVRHLRKHRAHLDRLFLRIACRTLDWTSIKSDLSQELSTLWSPNSVQEWTLAPLQQSDVMLAAQQTDLDPEAFLHAIYEKAASPLAAAPLDLRLLLDHYIQNDHSIPDTRFDLYEMGCLNRCREINPAHRARLRSSEQERLLVAGRIAAFSLFTNRPIISTSLEPQIREINTNQLAVRDVAGDQENLHGNTLSISEQLVLETLETALFQGGDKRLWSHKYYMEFLAAWYVTTIRSLSTLQIKTLLFDAEGRVVPQLYETAAWIADINDEIIEPIVEHDSHILLRGDLLSMNSHLKEPVAESLLKKADVGERWDLHIDRLMQGSLAHSSLDTQLIPYLDDMEHHINARTLAVHLAQFCNVQSVQSNLLQIARNTDEMERLRRDAISALDWVGDDETKVGLKPLALLPFSDEDNSDLKQDAVRVLWPEHISVEELFASFDIPEREEEIRGNVVGTNLAYFILPHISQEHIPPALEWIRNSIHVRTRIPQALEAIASGILFLAWSQIDEPAIGRDLAATVAHLYGKHIGYFFTDSYLSMARERVSIGQQLPEQHDKRRLLVQYLLDLLPDSNEWADALFCRGTVSIYQPSDILWLVEQYQQSTIEAQKGLIAKFIRLCIFRAAGLDVAIDALATIQEDSDLANAIGEDYVALLAEKIEANSQPKTIESNIEVEAISSSHVLSSRLHTKIIAELDKCDQGDLKHWRCINNLLCWNANDRFNIQSSFQLNLKRLPVWSKLPAHLKARIIAHSLPYVLYFDPQSVNWKADVENNRIQSASLSVMAGIHALMFFATDTPEKLREIPRETWERWSTPVTFFTKFATQFGFGLSSLNRSDEEKRAVAQLLTLVYANDKQGVLNCITWASEHRNGTILLDHVAPIWDDDIANRFLSAAPHSDSSTHYILISHLLESGFHPATLYTRGFLTTTLPAQGTEEHTNFAKIAACLLAYDTADSWEYIWAIIENDTVFGEAIFSHLYYSTLSRHFSAESLLYPLTDDAVYDLCVWLHLHFPKAADPVMRGIYSPTLRYELGKLRGAALYQLSKRGKADYIEQIAERFPDNDFLPALETARSQERQMSWQPFTPAQFLALIHEEQFKELTDAVVRACILLQGNLAFREIGLEDVRNTYISDILDSSGWNTRDQTRWGESATGKSPGELDILVRKDGMPYAVIEALNLDSLNKAEVDKHLIKVFNYDPTGLQQNFIVVYSSAVGFAGLWKRYVEYIPDVQYPYEFVEFSEIESYNFTDLKIGRATHKRNDTTISLYHILLNMNI